MRSVATPGTRRMLRFLGLGMALLLGVSAALGWMAYRRLNGNIRTDEVAARVLAEHPEERPPVLVPKARNVLVLGTRSASVTLLHVSADARRTAAAVTVPGDLMARTPGCTGCTIRAFEALTGIRVDHHVVIDLKGGGGAGGQLRTFATTTVTADAGLDSIPELYPLAELYPLSPFSPLVDGVRGRPGHRLRSVTVPHGPAAGALFRALREDRF
ncbi:LCP family protein [Streptomyces sp. RKAG293]|uniref:LCP family protein n=1 Tax=Streptomyces sp. RKAG293 TaxID=2893403 RepID=UPI0020337686|nr:LCP family protein [Streptomyces sp. RKAG293]MCM2420638.1 LCP family protein [Streptomyces sp. RKAG293]